MKRRKLLSLGIVTLMIISLLAGCGNKLEKHVVTANIAPTYKSSLTNNVKSLVYQEFDQYETTYDASGDRQEGIIDLLAANIADETIKLLSENPILQLSNDEAKNVNVYVKQLVYDSLTETEMPFVIKTGLMEDSKTECSDAISARIEEILDGEDIILSQDSETGEVTLKSDVLDVLNGNIENIVSDCLKDKEIKIVPTEVSISDNAVQTIQTNTMIDEALVNTLLAEENSGRTLSSVEISIILASAVDSAVSTMKSVTLKAENETALEYAMRMFAEENIPDGGTEMMTEEDINGLSVNIKVGVLREISQDMAGMKTQIDNIEGDVADMKKIVEELAEKVEIAENSNQVPLTEDALKNLDTVSAEWYAFSGSSELTLEQIESSLREMNDYVTSTASEIKAYKEAVDNIMQKIQQNIEVKGQTEDVTELRLAYDQFTQTINAQIAELDNFAAQLNSVAVTNEEFQAYKKGNAADLSTIKKLLGEVDINTDTYETITGGIASLQAQIDKYKTNFNTNLETISNSVDEMNAMIGSKADSNTYYANYSGTLWQATAELREAIVSNSGTTGDAFLNEKQEREQAINDIENQIENEAQNREEEEGKLANNIAEKFNPTKDYPAESFVVYENKLYFCRGAVLAGEWDSSKWMPCNVSDAIRDIVESIAPQYSTTTPYRIGDMVTYQNRTYVCTANTSGSWDSSKWNATNMADIISNIENSIRDTISENLNDTNSEIARLDDEIVNLWNGMAPEWSAGSNYRNGNVVHKNNKYYVCRTEHVSVASDFTSGILNPDKWDEYNTFTGVLDDRMKYIVNVLQQVFLELEEAIDCIGNSIASVYDKTKSYKPGDMVYCYDFTTEKLSLYVCKKSTAANTINNLAGSSSWTKTTIGDIISTQITGEAGIEALIRSLDAVSSSFYATWHTNSRNVQDTFILGNEFKAAWEDVLVTLKDIEERVETLESVVGIDASGRRTGSGIIKDVSDLTQAVTDNKTEIDEKVDTANNHMINGYTEAETGGSAIQGLSGLTNDTSSLKEDTQTLKENSINGKSSKGELDNIYIIKYNATIYPTIDSSNIRQVVESYLGSNTFDNSGKTLYVFVAE